MSNPISRLTRRLNPVKFYSNVRSTLRTLKREQKYYDRVDELPIQECGQSSSGIPYVRLNNGRILYGHPPSRVLRIAYRFRLSASLKARLPLYAFGVAYDIVIRNLPLPEGSSPKEKGRFPDVREGSTYVEAGGFMGYHAIMMADHVGPQGRVIVIEAIPENCEIIRLNIEGNNLSHVTLIEKAVSDKAGTLSMYRHSRQRASAYEHIAQGSTLFEIPADSIDGMLAEIGVTEVDYVRLQVNGVELEGLRGMSNTLSSDPELMIAAMYLREGEHTRDLILPYLAEIGYTAEVHLGHVYAHRH